MAGVALLRRCRPRGPNTYNVVDVNLAPGVAAPDTALDRNFYTTSSCGVCGKASIDAIRTRRGTTSRRRRSGCPRRHCSRCRTAAPAQETFDKTGGLHAAGLFTAGGELVGLREDVGRHNAVDKVIGYAVRAGRAADRHVLMVSGRASFELTQKAAMAGVPVLAAVSAPSSLAVELATDAGLTLVGFLRGDGCNVYSYTGARIVLYRRSHRTVGQGRPHCRARSA